MRRAQEATEKERRRVARQDVRREINAMPLPTSEESWLAVIQRLALPADGSGGDSSGRQDRIDHEEFCTFLNGPKHRDFVKWFLKKERARTAGASDKRGAPKWLDVRFFAVASF